jgi:hypothetical protein
MSKTKALKTPKMPKKRSGKKQDNRKKILRKTFKNRNAGLRSKSKRR